MAYVKNTWTTGDIITADKLNHMEDGIFGADGVFFLASMANDGEGNLSYGAYTKGSSFSDIYNAVSSGDASDFYIYITNTGGTYGQTYLPVPVVTFGTEADTTKYFSASMNDGTNTYNYYMSETGGVGIRINDGDYVNGTWTYDPDTMTYTISDGENPENNT